MLRADAKQMLILFIKVLSTKICYLLQIYCTAYITLLYFFIFPLILAFFVLFTLVVSGCHLSGWVWTGQDWNTWPRVFGPVGHVRTLTPARTTLLTWGSGTATEPKQHLKTYTLSSMIVTHHQVDIAQPLNRHYSRNKWWLHAKLLHHPLPPSCDGVNPEKREQKHNPSGLNSGTTIIMMSTELHRPKTWHSFRVKAQQMLMITITAVFDYWSRHHEAIARSWDKERCSSF